MSRSRTPLFVLVTLTTLLLTLSGCATVRPYVSHTSGDSYVMPHQMKLAKQELHRIVRTEMQKGRWVELVVNIHCFQDTRLDFCVSMGEFFNLHLRPISFTRVHWDMVPTPSLIPDATYVHWDVVPLVHDQ